MALQDTDISSMLEPPWILDLSRSHLLQSPSSDSQVVSWMSIYPATSRVFAMKPFELKTGSKTILNTTCVILQPAQEEGYVEE